MYSALKPGAVNPYLLKPKAQELDSLTRTMRSNLRLTSLTEGAPLTDYFDVFLYLKETHIDLFFSIDCFAGRVHTPVSSFHREYRPNILLAGKPVASLDVTTMQPLLLGKILSAAIGENEYSHWINSGEDIYLKLKDKANLPDRDAAKKRFFEILFSRANNQLADMFGHADWIEWINAFKSQEMPFNPHSHEKVHSNLAWLLQTTEVKIMRQVWQALKDNGIIFLSVHDEVLIQQADAGKAEQLFRQVLSREFPYFKLNSKGNSAATQCLELTQVAAEPLPAEPPPTEPEPVPEPEPCFDWKGYYLKDALTDYRKNYGSMKDNKPGKYISLWVNDMADLLRSRGINLNDFVEEWLKLAGHEGAESIHELINMPGRPAIGSTAQPEAEGYFYWLSFYCTAASKDFWEHSARIGRTDKAEWIRQWADNMQAELESHEIEQDVLVKKWMQAQGPDATTGRKQTWMPEIAELETYLSSISLPEEPIKLSPGSTITNCATFVGNHLATAKANDGNKTFLPYLERLRAFRQLVAEADYLPK
jgi:hypothetical protein